MESSSSGKSDDPMKDVKKLGLMGIINPNLKQSIAKPRTSNSYWRKTDSDSEKLSEASEESFDNFSHVLIARLTNPKSFYSNLHSLKHHEEESKEYTQYLEALLDLFRLFHNRQSDEFRMDLEAILGET